MAECERSDGYSFECLCIAHESFLSWWPGAEAGAVKRGREKVEQSAANQVAQVNADMEAWIKNRSCEEPCTKQVRKVPARLPAKIEVIRFNGMVQVTARLYARADVDCGPPEENPEVST